MKKRIVMSALCAVVVATAGYVGYKSMPKDAGSDLLLANVEALAKGEGCHYENGYKTWYTEKDPYSNSRKQEFYDCCEKLREGYDPSGSCN